MLQINSSSDGDISFGCCVNGRHFVAKHCFGQWRETAAVVILNKQLLVLYVDYLRCDAVSVRRQACRQRCVQHSDESNFGQCPLHFAAEGDGISVAKCVVKVGVRRAVEYICGCR